METRSIHANKIRIILFPEYGIAYFIKATISKFSPKKQKQPN